MKKKDKDTCPWWPSTERPAKLQFWLRDGFTLRDSDDIVKRGDLEISIGRTDRLPAGARVRDDKA